MNDPRLVCCACGAEPIVLSAPPLCAACERMAAALWRDERPAESVFACGEEVKLSYRLRIVKQRGIA